MIIATYVRHFIFPLSFENDMYSVSFFHCHLRMNLTVLHFFNSHLPMIFFANFVLNGLPYKGFESNGMLYFTIFNKSIHKCKIACTQ